MSCRVGNEAGTEAGILLSQMRLIDVKRLVRKIEYLREEIFERVRKAVKALL